LYNGIFLQFYKIYNYTQVYYKYTYLQYTVKLSALNIKRYIKDTLQMWLQYNIKIIFYIAIYIANALYREYRFNKNCSSSYIKTISKVILI